MDDGRAPCRSTVSKRPRGPREKSDGVSTLDQPVPQAAVPALMSGFVFSIHSVELISPFSYAVVNARNSAHPGRDRTPIWRVAFLGAQLVVIRDKGMPASAEDDLDLPLVPRLVLDQRHTKSARRLVDRLAAIALIPSLPVADALENVASDPSKTACGRRRGASIEAARTFALVTSAALHSGTISLRHRRRWPDYDRPNPFAGDRQREAMRIRASCRSGDRKPTTTLDLQPRRKILIALSAFPARLSGRRRSRALREVPST